MSMCCGKNRRGRFCCICGEELGKASDPIAEVVAYFRATIQAQETTLQQWRNAAAKEPATSGNYWKGKIDHKVKAIEKWRRWEKAIIDVIGNRDEPFGLIGDSTTKPKHWPPATG